MTLIDANNFHTFQPLLYQVATAGLDDENVSYAVRGIVRPRRGRRANVTFRMARVVGDRPRRPHASTSTTATPCRYDVLVVGAGAVSHDYGTPGVARAHVPAQARRRRAGPAGPRPRPLRAGRRRPVVGGRRDPRRRRLRRRADRRRDGRRAARAVPHGAGQGLPAAAGARRPGSSSSRWPTGCSPRSRRSRRGGPGARSSGATSRSILGVGVSAVEAGPGPPHRRLDASPPARSCGPPG